MKKNGYKSSCSVCSATVYKDGLCEYHFNQAEHSDYQAGQQSKSKPDSFWSRLGGWLTLFGFGGDE